MPFNRHTNVNQQLCELLCGAYMDAEEMYRMERGVVVACLQARLLTGRRLEMRKIPYLFLLYVERALLLMISIENTCIICSRLMLSVNRGEEGTCRSLVDDTVLLCTNLRLKLLHTSCSK